MSKWDSKNQREVYPYNERVDFNSINSICNQLEDAADLLDKVANNKLFDGGANLKDIIKDLTDSSKTFKVNGKFYDANLTTAKEGMTSDAKELRKIAKNIRSAARSRRNTEESQYNAYIWRIQEEERQAAANAGN